MNLFSRKSSALRATPRARSFPFLTLPPLKSDFDQPALYIIPRLRVVPAVASDIALVTHLDNAAVRFERAVLIGPHGAGKSAALAWLAAGAGARVVSLADFHPQALPDKFQNEGWILLDELSAPAHSAHLATLAARWPGARLWAATSDASLVPEGFTRLALEPFNEREIVSFAHALFPMRSDRGHAASRVNQPALDFVASIQADAGTRALATGPLDLFLLGQVYRPAGEARVAAAPVAQVALPMVGGNAAATPFDVPQRTNISPLPARRAPLLDEYVRARLASQADPEFASRALEGIALSTKRGQRAQPDHLARGYGLLQERPGGRIEFLHPLLQDFLAARALRRNPEFAPMAEHLAEPGWRDVALFYAGLGPSDEVVRVALDQDNLILAAQALAASSAPPPTLLDQVVKALVARAWEERDQAAMNALGSLRNNAASDFFAGKLRDKDPAVRLRAAYVLGKLHTDRALEYLLPQLRDPSPQVREQVIASLGASRSERVVEPLLVALRGDPRVPSTDTRLKVAAAHALGEYGTDKAVPALIVDLQVGEPEVQAEAETALSKIRSAFAVKPLEAIMATDKRPEGRSAAARVLDDMRGLASPRVLA